MSGLEGVGSVLEEAGGSGLGLTSSSSAYVRQSSCDTRGWGREEKSEINLKEFSPEIRQKRNYSIEIYTVYIVNIAQKKRCIWSILTAFNLFQQIYSSTLYGKYPLAVENIWVCRTCWSIQLFKNIQYESYPT